MLSNFAYWMTESVVKCDFIALFIMIELLSPAFKVPFPVCVTLCGSHCVGHIMWVMFCGSYHVVHVLWVTFCESHFVIRLGSVSAICTARNIGRLFGWSRSSQVHSKYKFGKRRISLILCVAHSLSKLFTWLLYFPFTPSALWKSSLRVSVFVKMGIK